MFEMPVRDSCELLIMNRKASLFELIGGLAVLDRVHKRFYDKVYAHAFWRQIKDDSLASFQDIDLKYERALIVPNPEGSTSHD